MRRPWLLAIPVLLASGMAAWWLLWGDGAPDRGESAAGSPAPAAATGRPSPQERDPQTPGASSAETGATTPRAYSAPPNTAAPRGEHSADRGLPLAASRQLPDPSASATGPSPMSQAGQVRVDAMLERLRQSDRNTEEYELLAGSEPRDADWSGRMEATLRHAILRHGGASTGLEVSAPRCTQTLCRLTAASHAAATDRPDSDWQRLVYAIAGERWWRQEFFDVSTSVTSDDRGMLYVTYFLRK